MMNKERIYYLLTAYQQQLATKEEEIEFAQLLHDEQYAEIFHEILDANWTSITAAELQETEFAGDHRILKEIKQNSRKVVSAQKLWPRLAAAAAIILVLFSVGFFLLTNNKKQEEIHFANDITPGKNGATLTLADGRKIAINDAITGNFVSEGGVKIYKNKEGQIVYDIDEKNSEKVTYNTLTTTRGEQIQVRLPDQTLVFLNAESSLKFPTSFAHTPKRSVTLAGEGYFEVSKDKQHPFIVQSNQQQIEVLGTTFNINSYTDEPNIKTTLLEGSVRVTNLSTKEHLLLTPGQQAVMTEGKLLSKVVETEDIIAWKNGYFMFNNETLASIMKRVSKWYDMEVIYKNSSVKDKIFFGAVSRYGNISELLKVLQATEVASFEIKGRQVIVSSKE